MTNSISKTILLIEDNLGNIKLFEEAIKENDLLVDLHVLNDGGKAINFIEEVDSIKDKKIPDIVILDLNLPKVDGKTVLKSIKKSQKLLKTPVIILTTSKLNSDINECYDLGANAYLSKSFDIAEFFEIVALIDKFWLRNCHLPKQPD